MASLRHVTDPKEAQALAPPLDRHAEQAMAEFRDHPLPRGVVRRFLEESFGASETVLLVAESKTGAADLGVCLVGPFVDPLLGTRLPMVLILYVDEAARHRGLGRALVEEAGRILEARGLFRLAARAGHNDDALISMGERFGFVRQWDLMLRE